MAQQLAAQGRAQLDSLLDPSRLPPMHEFTPPNCERLPVLVMELLHTCDISQQHEAGARKLERGYSDVF